LFTGTTPRTADITAPMRRLHQLQTLVVWFGAGLFALGAAIILADLVFPQPTILRLPLMLGTVSAVGLLVARRRRDRDAGISARQTGQFGEAFPKR
jgi:hypothetical protein